MTPPVCVITATYNRAAMVADLVAALQAQDLADFEAVIVDDGSTDGTFHTTSSLIAHDPRFRVMRSPENGGPARARNLGWRSATAPLIAFTDDDCLPDRDWLSNLVDAAQAADVVQGRTIPMEAEQPGWFDRTVSVPTFSGRFQTCNLLVPRVLLEAVDGFRGDFPPMGEDTDLGLRLVAEGATTSFADGAVVRHHVWPGSFRNFMAHRRIHARLVHLFKVNPDSRHLLMGGLVVRLAHLVALATILLVGVAAIVGHPVAWAAAAVPAGGWVAATTFRTRNRSFAWPRRVFYCGLMFVGYTCELGFFLRESVRERTLVL